MKAIEESLTLKGIKSCEMDYTLNRENEKFKKVDEALKGHIYSISIKENTWK